MTRRDFELIAAAVKEARSVDDYTKRERDALDTVSFALSRKLTATNDRFNRDRFLRACGVDQ